MDKVWEFRGDWYTAEDAEVKLYPHDIAGHVEAADARSAITAVERYFAVGGEVVIVTSLRISSARTATAEVSIR